MASGQTNLAEWGTCWTRAFAVLVSSDITTQKIYRWYVCPGHDYLKESWEKPTLGNHRTTNSIQTGQNKSMAGMPENLGSKNITSALVNGKCCWNLNLTILRPPHFNAYINRIPFLHPFRTQALDNRETACCAAKRSNHMVSPPKACMHHRMIPISCLASGCWYCWFLVSCFERAWTHGVSNSPIHWKIVEHDLSSFSTQHAQRCVPARSVVTQWVCYPENHVSAFFWIKETHLATLKPTGDPKQNRSGECIFSGSQIVFCH